MPDKTNPCSSGNNVATDAKPTDEAVLIHEKFCAARELPDINERFLAVVDGWTPGEKTDFDAMKEAAPIQLCRVAAAKRIADKKGSYTYPELQDLTGVNAMHFAKFAAGARPVALPPDSILSICRNLTKCSCHELMFGEKGEIVLPDAYSSVAAAYDHLSADKKTEYADKAKCAVKDYSERIKPDKYTNLHRPMPEIIAERLSTVISSFDLFRHPILSSRIRMALKTVGDSSSSSYTGLTSLMYVAFETGRALDYFICEDFTQCAPVYFNCNRGKILMRASSALSFTGAAFTLPESDRRELFAEVLLASALDK